MDSRFTLRVWNAACLCADIRRSRLSAKQRVIRVQADARLLQHMTVNECRAVYDELEAARDALSKILDKADGKR